MISCCLCVCVRVCYDNRICQMSIQPEFNGKAEDCTCIPNWINGQGKELLSKKTGSDKHTHTHTHEMIVWRLL